MEILYTAFDMLPDVAGILLAALSLSLIFLPKELKTLDAEKWKYLRWSLAALFAVVGIGGLISNALQKSKDKTERQKLNDQVARLKDDVQAVQLKLDRDTNAAVAIVGFRPRGGAEELSAGLFKWDIAYGVTQNIAKRMRSFTTLQLEVSKGIDDRKVWAKFNGVAAQRIAEEGQGHERAIGSMDWDTIEIQLQQKDVDGIMSGTKTLYILGLTKWENPAGTDGHFDFCSWMQQPKAKHLNYDTAIWHNCVL